MLCLTLYHIVRSQRNILLWKAWFFWPPSPRFHLNSKTAWAPPFPQDFQVQRPPTHPDFYKIVRHLNLNLHSRVREKFSYPLILRTSIILNLVVRNPRVLVQTFLRETQNNWAFNVFYHIIILVNCFWLKNKWNSHGRAKFKRIFNLILSSMRFASMTITEILILL